jgi:hypothetical protein
MMALFFMAIPVMERIYSSISGEERLAIKLLYGAQIGYALAVVILSDKSAWKKNRVALSFLLLFMWVCMYEIHYGADLEAMFYKWITYGYWMSLLLFFFVSSLHGQKFLKKFIFFIVITTILWVPAIMHFANMATEAAGLGLHRRQDYSGYYIVALLPYILLTKKHWQKIVAVAFISFGSIYSLKRGVVLALVLMGFSSTIVYILFVGKRRNLGKNIIGIIGLSAIAVASAMIFLRDNSDDAIRRMNEDTGRSRIYSRSYEIIKSRDFGGIVLGNTDRRIEDDLGILPHNDWLYLLHDYGVFGIFIMTFVYLALFGFLRRLCKTRSPLAIPLVSSIVLMFCIQMYSYGFFYKIFGYITGGIGIVLGLDHAKRMVESQKCNPQSMEDK